MGGVLSESTKVDVAVVGGGIVGLATAYSVLRKSPTTSLILIEKEASAGPAPDGAQFWSRSLGHLLQTRIVEGCSLPQGVEALSSSSQSNMAFAFASSANSSWPWRRANFHTCMLSTKEAWRTG